MVNNYLHLLQHLRRRAKVIKFDMSITKNHNESYESLNHDMNTSSIRDTPFNDPIADLESFMANVNCDADFEKDKIKPNPSFNVNLFYERLIIDLRSEINFLRDQLNKRDDFYRDEVTFLRNQFSNLQTRFKLKNSDDFSNEKQTDKVYNERPNMTSTKEINETPINKNRVNSISSESHDPKDNEKIIKIDATNITNRNQKGKSKGKNDTCFSSNDTPPHSEKDKKKKSIIICGDSIVNGIVPSQIASLNEQRISVQPFGGASSTDMLDFVKPLIRRNPETFIFHIGANDITSSEEIDTIENIRTIKELFRKDLPNCDFVLSECTVRNDRKGITKKVNKLNEDLHDLATELNIEIIKHSAISQRHLAKRKLHLNDKGKALLALDYRDYLDNV